MNKQTRKPQLTPEQQQAVQTIDCNVSVSAGAGSGKTKVLTARFINILAQGWLTLNKFGGADKSKGSVNAADIMAITFTRKAAAEMKSRIRGELEKLASGDIAENVVPGADLTEKQLGESRLFWAEQVQLLERARIGTINSLCSFILRDNPVEAELDPGFAVVEDYEESEFFADCLESFLRRELKHDNQDLKHLLNVYGVYSFKGQVQTLSAHLADIAAEEDLQSPYKACVLQAEQLGQKLCAALEKLVADRDILTSPKSKGRTALEVLAANLDGVKAGISVNDFAAFDNYVVSIKNTKGALNMALAEVKNYAGQIKARLKAADDSVLRCVYAWQQVLRQLHAYVQERKHEQNILTNDDLERMAVALLAAKPAVRQKYHSRFKHIMVDEFQDTNERQRQLVYLLCGDAADKLEGGKLFIVGDPKQSIYRFRNADVSVFARVRREIAATGGRDLQLSVNFRSKDVVLDACNDTFRRLLGEDRDKPVFFEALSAFKLGGTVKPVLLTVPVQEGDDKRAKEAAAVAQELLRLHCEEGVPYGEMAVLLRAMTHCGELAAAMESAGVPYNITDGRGFYARQEVLDLLNVLTVLHNPGRSIELAGVLRSPYFGLDDITITKLFLCGGDGLWQNLLRAVPADFGAEQGARLQRAAMVLSKLHSSAALLALPQLWQQLWQDLGVDIVLPQQKYGEGKLANAKKLRQMAVEYGTVNQAGLGSWLQYVRKVRAAKIKETAANLDNASAVQVLTIHKAKGLQYKTVFVPMIDSSNGGADTTSIKYLSGMGLGIKAVDKESGKLENTIVLDDVKAKDKQMNNQERVRLLYVAMTRAEERLILSAADKEKSKKSTKSGKEKDKDKEKDLLAGNWLQQLQDIFSDKTSLEQKIADSSQKQAQAEQIKQQLEVTPALEQQIAPLPGYAANGRSSFTASALQSYLHCQRYYYYQQVLALPELEEETALGTAQLPAYVTGLVVHRTLELVRGGDLAGAFQKALQQEQLMAAPKAWEMLVRYSNSDLYRQLPPKQQRELRFKLLTQRGITIDGVIDCVGEADDGSLVLVDYKTGAPAAGAVKPGYACQLALYKLAAENILHKRVSSAQLHFLQDLSVWELPPDDCYLQQAYDLCAEIAAKSTEQDFACAVDAGCSYCPYAYLCPQKADE